MKKLALATALCAMAACGPATPSRDSATGDSSDGDARLCAPSSRKITVVLARIAFVREESGRTDVADGFDLDGRVSAYNDRLSCGAGDMTSPDGSTMGIDNQLARLLPTIDAMTGGALDGALQGAINNGQMLVTVTIDNVDDACNDNEVDVTIQRVAGMPFVGSDMLVDPGQTFDLMRTSAMTRARGRIVNRVLQIDPVDLPLPVAILDASFIITFYNARMRIELTEDGSDARGLIGGGISLAEFRTILAPLNIPDALRNTANSALAFFADLERNSMNKCERISGAMRVIARPAFVLE